MTGHRRLPAVLLGSTVTLLTVPTGVGPAAGGWLAGRGTQTPVRGAVAGGVAGIVGALPWVGLVYLACAGAIDPVGYHDGYVHVGLNPAAPETLALWQEIGLGALAGSAIVAVAVCGGLLAGHSADVARELREEFAESV